MAELVGPRAVVLGSVHMDLIAEADRLPGVGESVTGGVFAMAPGGKAGNQACQLAVLGIETAVVTRLGDDLFGKWLTKALADKGVVTDWIVFDTSDATGASTIFAGGGDYSSIIAPGAAANLSDGDLRDAQDSGLFQGTGMLLLQLELPIGISLTAAKMARAVGWQIWLNGSPMPTETTAQFTELMGISDVVILNRVEAARLLKSGADVDLNQLAANAQALVPGATVIVTSGASGVAWVGPDAIGFRSALPADVVDTVGAGDAFLGATAAGVLRGTSMEDALDRGVAAGAIAVERRGAYDSLPSDWDINHRLTQYRISQ